MIDHNTKQYRCPYKVGDLVVVDTTTQDASKNYLVNGKRHIIAEIQENCYDTHDILLTNDGKQAFWYRFKLVRDRLLTKEVEI